MAEYQEYIAKLLKLKVKDIMSKNVVAVKQDTNILEINLLQKI